MFLATISLTRQFPCVWYWEADYGLPCVSQTRYSNIPTCSVGPMSCYCSTLRAGGTLQHRESE